MNQNSNEAWDKLEVLIRKNNGMLNDADQKFFSEHMNPFVRGRLAHKCQNLREDIQKQFLNDENSFVHISLSFRKNLCKEVQMYFMDKQGFGCLRNIACYCENLYEKTQEFLASHKSSVVRRSFARHCKNIPYNIQRNLANDREKSVRQAMATNVAKRQLRLFK